MSLGHRYLIELVAAHSDDLWGILNLCGAYYISLQYLLPEVQYVTIEYHFKYFFRQDKNSRILSTDGSPSSWKLPKYSKTIVCTGLGIFIGSTNQRKRGKLQIFKFFISIISHRRSSGLLWAAQSNHVKSIEGSVQSSVIFSPNYNYNSIST